MREFFRLMTHSALSIIGSLIATVSAVMFLALFAIAVAGHEGSPYLGIFSFVILPSIFVFGLLLIPVGIALRRRREARLMGEGKPLPAAPVIDFNDPRTLKVSAIIAALTVVNIAIVSAAAYKGIEVMDSTEFCGTACHTVMSPEYTTYQRSPHARVNCTECHIGSGANWFVKSKLSGSWQLVSVAFDLFPRPIPTPVHHLRPARETCEECHWPEKFVGDRLQVRTRFEENEEQTETKTVLLMKVGGVHEGQGHGIHWHVDRGNEVRYLSDLDRKTVFEVELRNAEGQTRRWKRTEGEAAPADAQWRTMDCIDCHNRPTHVYRMPEPEMDDALRHGAVDKSLPFIKRESLRLLKESYASHEEARVGIREGLVAFYKAEYPEVAARDLAKIESSAQGVWDIYRQNVFPAMKITWGTYPNNIGHDGCFRCHDKKHADEKGKTISKDCSLCHETLATQEEQPEILEVLYP